MTLMCMSICREGRSTTAKNEQELVHPGVAQVSSPIRLRAYKDPEGNVWRLSKGD